VLQERVPTDATIAKALALEVHDELLVKVRESLHTMYPDSIDPVSHQSVERETRPVIHNEMPKIPPAPVPAPILVPKVELPAPKVLAPLPTSTTPSPIPASPAIKEPSLNKAPFSPIDEALHAPTETKPVQIDVSPKKQAPQYTNDPYLEPIE
jgi:hypothetical protein